MNRLTGDKLTEETILFINVVRWVFLASVVGAIVGLATAYFLKILRWTTTFGNHHPYYFLLLPIALFLSILTIQNLAPDAEGHGTEKVIKAIHKRAGKIDAIVIPVKLVTTLITLVAGGSVGKEGPCAQIGGGLSSMFADLFKFNDRDRKKLVICGISAGFAAVFGTPISGAIFGVEVLFVGSILYEVLLPSFIAGITSYEISSALGITYFYHPISLVPVFSESFFLKVLIAGIFIGLCSVNLIELMSLMHKLAAKIKIWMPLKGLIGGIALIGLTFIFDKQYLGLGLNTIEVTLTGTSIVWYAFFMKSLYTAITLEFGGSGGIVTPIFFIGAAAGSVFGRFMGLDPATFAAIGMVAALAGAANTPISASIMAMEIFGPTIAPYTTVACIISYLITGHRSVYPTQVLSKSKSPFIHAELGEEMDHLHLHASLRDKTVFTFLKFIRNIRKKTKNKNEDK